MERYTIEQVRLYVEGWLCSESKCKSLSKNEILSMLKNAANCLECPQDGIESFFERLRANIKDEYCQKEKK